MILIPPEPALVAGSRGALMLTPDGEVLSLSKGAAARRALAEHRPMFCHGPATAARLGIGVGDLRGYDLLTLFAFVHPARFCTPTPRGLAEVVGLRPPGSPEEAAATLPMAVGVLLRRLAGASEDRRRAARGPAFAMAQAGWAWGQPVLAALDPRGEIANAGGVRTTAPAQSLEVWKALPDISEHTPEASPGHEPVAPEEARQKLAELLGPQAEDRPQQADYATGVCAAFHPRDRRDNPNLVLAEAGTGTGKTLGYIAPAGLWADRNEGSVWISTYTRNLQRQLDLELDRLYDDPVEKSRRVVVRKGRENYLCLLNYQESLRGSGASLMGGQAVVALGLTARWIQATRDGDMVGGDFPGWLPDLIGREHSVALADRRGECIFSACEHYNRCFVERAVRRARRARLVVANHALVIVQAALGGLDDDTRPTRYVFDEGHHLFDAADSAFSAHLSGVETSELRRWLLGGEPDAGGGPGGGPGGGSGRSSRARGLKKRCEGLFDFDGETGTHLNRVLRAARQLPAPNWQSRVASESPYGPIEALLAVIRTQVMARARGVDGPHGLETETRPPLPALLELARAAEAALADLAQPLKDLREALDAKLEDTEQVETMDVQTRKRIEGVLRAMDRRALTPLAAWREMLGTLESDPPEAFADWLGVDRMEGREVDIGMHRHWLDPALPLAEAVLRPAHGVVVTSATLKDGSGDPLRDWDTAEARSGARHLEDPGYRIELSSPFDYAAQTRVLIVTDVRKDDLGQVGAAYGALFKAAGGGALGLFTAVARLRAVHSKIAAGLEAEGIDLFAQHVDAMDMATLIEIFRSEEDSCLLGTDAARDGVDVPGRSLRLVVFDRVPWPRPDILHKARRAQFGGRAYDDMITRLRLKQAFGRLVRRAEDRGVFVLLDPMMPSRLFGAFPPQVTPERVGLAEAVEIVKGSL